MLLENTIQVKNKIGNGAYGEVYLGQDINTNKKYAIKKISKRKLLNSEMNIYFNNELKILKNLKPHPNIIRFYSIESTILNHYIIEEYCNGGNLNQVIKKKMHLEKKAFSEDEAKYIIKNILNGLSNLHSQNIIHRDLKTDNILLNYNNIEDLLNQNIKKAEIKIIDFGFSRYLKKNEEANSILGTPLYMDPIMLECINSGNLNETGYDNKIDIWSIGIITYYILMGNLPFIGHTCDDLFKTIQERKYILPKKSEFLIITKGCLDFIDKVLNIDINLRPSAQELLLNDSWINDTNDKFELYSLKKDLNKNNKFIYFSDYWEKKNFFDIQTIKRRSNSLKGINDQRKKRINDLLGRLLKDDNKNCDKNYYNLETIRKINEQTLDNYPINIEKQISGSIIDAIEDQAKTPILSEKTKFLSNYTEIRNKYKQQF